MPGGLVLQPVLHGPCAIGTVAMLQVPQVLRWPLCPSANRKPHDRNDDHDSDNDQSDYFHRSETFRGRILFICVRADMRTQQVLTDGYPGGHGDKPEACEYSI